MEKVETYRKEGNMQVFPDEAFEKEDILKSDSYKEKRDIVMALLTKGRKYSRKEIDSLIDAYEKGEVK